MVLIPEGNMRDLKEIPDNVKDDLDIRPVKWIDEVLDIALESVPTALTDEQYLSKDFTPAAQSDEKSVNNQKNLPKAH
jgi:ATP-dependent Lon protease